jgi:TPR repeat protein
MACASLHVSVFGLIIIAPQYFKLCADQNHMNGQFHYGLCLVEGLGVPITYAGASRYFKISADGNSAGRQAFYARRF